MGYSMPELSSGRQPSIKPDAIFQNRPSVLRSKDVASAGPSPSYTTSADKPAQTPSAYRTRQQGNKNPDGKDPSLVRDASGREHYIGPSGGLQFLGQLRRLLISREQDSQSGAVGSPHSISRFTEDDGAQALEADDHPGTHHSMERDEEAEDNGANHVSPGSTTSTVNEFIRNPLNNIEDQWKNLPSQHLLDELIQSYFQNVHDDFPLFHRATFEDEYECFLKRVKCEPPTQASLETLTGGDQLGWQGCFCMILVFGSMSRPQIGTPALDHTALRRQCVSLSRSLLSHFISKSSLNNIRALLLLAHFLHNNNERNATWNLVGTATRIAFALGLHREATGAAFRPIEREVRKKVFCTLYSFEQFLASSLGRPSGINDADVEVVPPRAGLLDSAQGAGDAIYMTYGLQLHRLLGRTRASHSAAGDAGQPYHEKQRIAEDILRSLKEWEDEVSKQSILKLPTVQINDPLFDHDLGSDLMRFEDLKKLLGWQSRPNLRANLVLRLQYHYIALLVTRPFLLLELSLNGQDTIREAGGSESSSIPEPTPDNARLADICLRHAGQLTSMILLLDSFGLVNGVSGLDVFYIYWACMVLCLGMLRRPGAYESPHTPERIAKLVTDLREVVDRVEKSGTMRRFARLVGAFADYVNHRVTPARINEDTSDAQMTPSGLYGKNFDPQAMSSATPMMTSASSAPLDPFYWSDIMWPLGNTIEGGAGLDSLAAGIGFQALGDGGDWMTATLGGGVDMSSMGNSDANAMPPHGRSEPNS